MARIGSITGIKLIGCPVTVPVTADTYQGDVTFQRVRLKVTTSPGGQVFDFSRACDGGNTVEIDISSALVAIAGRYEYTATGVNPAGAGGYPNWTFAVEASDEYMKDGVSYTGKGVVTASGLGNMYAGSLTDRERLFNERPSRWSRKPASSPEIVYNGMTWIVAGAFSNAPMVSAYIVGTDTIPDSANIYAMAAPADSYEMRFINSLGVHESLHILCLKQGDTAMKTDRYTIAVSETLTKFSRGLAVKKNDHEQWKMSSPPLDEKWQQWYMHEVLKARHAWIKIDGQWLAVHIIPEETVRGIDRVKATPLTVEFTIEFDINGSPFK